MTKLNGKLALVTGASRGIGAAVAKALAAEGAKLILVARNSDDLEKVDDAIQSAGGEAAVLAPCDLKDFEKIDQLGASIATRYGKLDILVGNAGMLGGMTPLSHFEPDVWKDLIDLNLTANYRLIRSFEPLLKASDAGRIIMTTSTVAQNPTAYFGPYSISKTGLETLIKIYALETAKTNVKINAVAPPATNTKMLEEAYPGGFPKEKNVANVEDLVPLYLKLASADYQESGQILTL